MMISDGDKPASLLPLESLCFAKFIFIPYHHPQTSEQLPAIIILLGALILVNGIYYYGKN